MPKKIRCRPIQMPEVFKWGDTTPNWDDEVDEYMALRTFNRLCQVVNRRSKSGREK